VISVRPNGDTISIWHKNSRNPAHVESIRQNLIDLLNLPEDIKLDYAEFFPDNKNPVGGQGGRREERKEERKYPPRENTQGGAGGQH
jgi:hypothetical protein